MDDQYTVWSVLVVFFIVMAIYMIPTIVAFHRQHPSRWFIGLVNFVFGCSIIGWFGSLIWASHAFHKSPSGSNGGETGLNIFINDVSAAEKSAISNDAVQSLTRLKSLLDQGVISDAEFTAMKNKYLLLAMQ